MDSTSEIVSAVLQDFYEGETDLTVLAESCKVLSKLVSNASKQSELKYRRVNLQNARIQAAVVTVPGALDILGLAGFAKVDDGSALVYTDSPRNREMSQVICFSLDEKFDELKRLGAVVAPAAEAKSKTKASTPPAKPKVQPASVQKQTNNSPFLSEEERQRRREAAIAARKVREAERSRALSRWKEDEEDRKIKISRQEAASLAIGLHDEDETPAVPNVRASLLCPEIRIKRLEKPSAEIVAGSTAQDHATPPKNVLAATAAAAAAVSGAKMGDEQDSEKGVAPMEEGEANTKQAAAATPMDVDLDEQQKADEEAYVWKEYLKSTPRCTACQGIRETSVFRRYYTGPSTGSGGPGPLRRLLKELDSMNESLPDEGPCTIFVRFDEETPQYLRAIIPAALPGPTPYAGGLFLFDIYVPDDYPQVAPKVQLMNTGGGSVRFGPNLYADGKVCLSLLGTWEGPKWQPGISSLNQVLISIQGLILGAEHPYYLEPGHGGWEGDIKEGSFVKIGQTLAGNKVKEDLVPLKVAIYEDNLRIGTLRYAMIDMIRAIANKPDQSPPSTMDTFLQPFRRPIWLHFYHNRVKILKEVECWTRGSAAITGDDDMAGSMMDSTPETQKQYLAHLQSQMSSLFPRLTGALGNLDAPPLEDVGFSGDKKLAASTLAAPSLSSPPETASVSEDEKKSAAPQTPSDALRDMREKMQEAAASGNYVLAGEIQASIVVVEELKTSMEQAAHDGDFIRAGRLQQQLNARMENLGFDGAESSNPGPVAAAAGPVAYQDDSAFFEENPDGSDNSEGDQDFEETDEVDEEDMEGGVWNGGGGFHGEGYSWGSGVQLNGSSSTQQTQPTAPASSKSALPVPYKSKRSSGSTCRLRVRLPGTPSSITEQFDAEDTLADLYEHVDQYIQRKEANNLPAGVANAPTRKLIMTEYGPQMVEESTFSRPLSLKGFTLLLAHPKREFSLEMHGTMQLKQLQLVPSATLTVMMCQERGVVRRGDLEGRLAEAQGDAMDVEGLSYEGLLELTERVGHSNKWTPESQAKLELNSSLISPAQYLEELNARATSQEASEKDRRCPICLGDFDEMDSQKNLRRLNVCAHVYHIGCLGTWLQAKSACPMCKMDIA